MSEEERSLVRHTQAEQAGGTAERRAREVVDASQVIRLHYTREEPYSERRHKGLSDDLQRAGASVTGIDHHTEGGVERQQALSVVLSVFRGARDKGNWLELIQMPTDSGYQLEYARVLSYDPSMDVKRSSFLLSREIVASIASELGQLKGKHEQLQGFGDDSVFDGSWRGGGESGSLLPGNWPEYPRVVYTHGLGEVIPGSKGAREKVLKDWCVVEVRFDVETGDLSARPYGGRSYPRQGICARWWVDTAPENTTFRGTLVALIDRAMKPLDEYEKRLGQEAWGRRPSGDRPGRP